MMDNLRAWWSGLSPREHTLLAGAAGLTALFAVVFLLLLPMRNAHKQAFTRLETVQLEHERVRRGVASLQGRTATPVAPAQNVDEFRSLVTEAAGRNGLSVSRLQTVSGGRLQIVLESVSPQKVYAWLDELSETPGGAVQVATIEAREAGDVEAVVELLAGGE